MVKNGILTNEDFTVPYRKVPRYGFTGNTSGWERGERLCGIKDSPFFIRN